MNFGLFGLFVRGMFRIVVEWKMIKRLLSKGSESCSETEFECSPGDCIPKNWLCDFHRDCTDGMDEKNCGSKLSINPKVDCWNQQGTKEKKNEKKKKLWNTYDKEELFTLEEKKERESWNSVLKSQIASFKLLNFFFLLKQNHD